MRTYSPFFQTLHDEAGPIGWLGQGTHYSVLRATVFHDHHRGRLIDGAAFLDFAVIWDDDHDERVLLPIERLYRSGDLSQFIMFGERKGMLCGLASPKLEPVHDDMAQTMLQKSCDLVDGDHWFAQLVSLQVPGAIINDADANVSLYLKTISMLWKLGLKKIVEPKSTEVDDPNCIITSRGPSLMP